jgi:D-sedoheptulose 7-phosphate isomerase
MNPIADCREYFQLLAATIQKLPFAEIDQLSDVLVRAYREEHAIFLFGNGGSAALASHFACDLSKGTVTAESQKRFRVMALTDNVPIMTAWANDSKYEDIFSQQLATFARPGDVAFAISGSGNSPNILRALAEAKKVGLSTAGLSGFAGGRMISLCDACIVIPSDNMQIIEDLHLCVAHAVFTCVRAKITSQTPVYEWMRPGIITRTAGK